jgi:lipopolysaccharide biosynthesis glycosyltransferase
MAQSAEHGRIALGTVEVKALTVEDQSTMVHVLLASDSATSAGLAVAGYSAIKQTSRPVVIWVVQEGLDNGTVAELRAFWSGAAEVHFLTMKGFPWWWATERFPLVTWARLQVGELLPPDIKRCIWLDTDTLVGRDLGELVDLPLEGNFIAMAVEDSLLDSFISYYESLGIAPDQVYNSGVLLVDVEAWRKNAVRTELIHCKRSMPSVLWFADQDVLNKYFAGRIMTLDRSWNRRDWAHAPKGQILHFKGSPKPWELSEDSGLAGLSAWREIYALWGRPPVPKRSNKLKLKSASVVRRLVALGR